MTILHEKLWSSFHKMSCKITLLKFLLHLPGANEAKGYINKLGIIGSGDGLLLWFSVKPYLNQCQVIVNWILCNKLHWNFYENLTIFTQQPEIHWWKSFAKLPPFSSAPIELKANHFSPGYNVSVTYGCSQPAILPPTLHQAASQPPWQPATIPAPC